MTRKPILTGPGTVFLKLVDALRQRVVAAKTRDQEAARRTARDLSVTTAQVQTSNDTR